MPRLQSITAIYQPAEIRAVRLMVRRWISVVTVIGMCWLTGCRTVQSPVALPAKFSLEGEQLLVHSDVRLPKDHPLIADLANLRRQIAETLELPVQDQPVTVYLFSDELRYAQYMKAAFPQLPPRHPA